MIFSQRFALALTVAVVLIPAHRATAHGLCRTQPSDIAASTAFERKVETYIELRRQLASSLPPLRAPADVEVVAAAVNALATAIYTARADARTGDIFDPQIKRFLRGCIMDTLAADGMDVRDLLAEIDEEALSDLDPVVVNGRFPWNRGAVMWPTFLSTLPNLPKELQYRFVGHDLVLLDVDAELVIDILEGALPSVEIPGILTRASHTLTPPAAGSFTRRGSSPPRHAALRTSIDRGLARP